MPTRRRSSLTPPIRSSCSSCRSRAPAESAFPDGSVMRIGYADQNGREYVGDRTAASRTEHPACRAGRPCRASRTGSGPIRTQGRALMRENLSYIFFRELTGPGPLGAINVPVVAARDGRRRSEVRSAWRTGLPRARPARGLRLLGGAGHGRRDQGRRTASIPSGAHGAEATQIAGGMSAKGVALILVPKGSAPVARCRAPSTLTKPSSGLA